MIFRAIIGAIIAATVLWVATVPSLAANEFVLGHRSDFITINVVRGDKGLLIDTGIAESAGEGPYAKYFVGEIDVSREVVNFPAQAEFLVYFAGQGGELVCRLNTYISEVGRIVGFVHRAFADGPAPCRGISAAGSDAADLKQALSDLSEGYVRKILLIVSPRGSSRYPVPPIVWRSKIIDANRVLPASGFPNDLSQFLRSAAQGRLNFLPHGAYAGAVAPVTMVIGTQNKELERIPLLKVTWLDVVMAHRGWIAVAIVGLAVFAIAVLLVMHRRGKRRRVITRSIRIGYGSDFQIDLGAAESPRGVMNILFDNQGGITAERIGPDDAIFINDKRLRDRRPLTASDRLRINERNIRFQDEKT